MFEINGLDQFTEDIRNMTITTQEKETILKKAVAPLKSEIVSTAESFWDTGELMKSFKEVVKGGQAYVTSNVKHAWILEYCSKYNHAGYFSGAVENAEDNVLRVIDENLFKGGWYYGNW